MITLIPSPSLILRSFSLYLSIGCRGRTTILTSPEAYMNNTGALHIRIGFGRFLTITTV